MKKCYISGAITGLPPGEVQAKFAAAERILTEQGYEVISPLKNGLPCHCPYEQYMAVDIVLLIGCEAVYFLPDWSLSKGATLEKNIAELTGKTIIYENVPVFAELKQAISEVMGVSFYELVNDSRERNLVYARMTYAYFCKEQGATVADIAAEMRRSHSAIYYYLKKYSDDFKFNPKFREIVNRIETALSQGRNAPNFKLNTKGRYIEKKMKTFKDLPAIKPKFRY
ncbi:MAG: DUF4406 domain-containing protein [Prevotellaceae bacterium]|jgi:hypothetical protein|nr:DUF4406 domain-containing protein [Prevotellaceae bacterium]